MVDGVGGVGPVGHNSQRQSEIIVVFELKLMQGALNPKGRWHSPFFTQMFSNAVIPWNKRKINWNWNILLF